MSVTLNIAVNEKDIRVHTIKIGNVFLGRYLAEKDTLYMRIFDGIVPIGNNNQFCYRFYGYNSDRFKNILVVTDYGPMDVKQ